MAAPSETIALPTAADVDAAAAKLAGVALRTPLITSPVLDALLGARVFLKAETLQRTGSFKFRGAYNKLSSIPAGPARRRRGGLFLRQPRAGRRRAAQLLGMPAVIVMPRTRRSPSASAPRRSAPRSCSTTATAKTARRSRAASPSERGAMLVPPFDDPMMIAGQGTVGREIVEDLAALGLTAGRGGGRRFRRRADRGHCARDQGARAGGEVLHRRAGRLRRHRALVPERPARAQRAHERHDLRRADDQHAGRASPSRSTASLVGEGVTASDDEVGRAVGVRVPRTEARGRAGRRDRACRAARRAARRQGQGRGRGAVRRQCRRRTVPPPGRAEPA